MIFLAVREELSVKEPMGFNCGPSQFLRAQLIAYDLRRNLSGSMEVLGPESANGDFTVTIVCRQGTLASVILLVECWVAVWRARGWRVG